MVSSVGLGKGPGCKNYTEPLFVAQGLTHHDVPSRQVLHHQVQELLILKGVVQLHNVGVVYLSKNIALSFYMLYLQKLQIWH